MGNIVSLFESTMNIEDNNPGVYTIHGLTWFHDIFSPPSRTDDNTITNEVRDTLGLGLGVGVSVAQIVHP